MPVNDTAWYANLGDDDDELDEDEHARICAGLDDIDLDFDDGGAFSSITLARPAAGQQQREIHCNGCQN